MHTLDATEIKCIWSNQIIVSLNWFCSPNGFIRLDYPGVGPEHSFLKDLGRAEYYSITDEEALEGDK